MIEKRFNVILKCEQKGNKQECEYYVEMDGIETPLRDILYENEQLKQALKFLTDRYDCSVLQNDDWRAEKGYYKHNKEYCKKWGLDMTDKQFVLVKRRFDYTLYEDGTSSIYDRKDDKYYFDMNLDGLEELLNNLDEENEQLKEQNEKYIVMMNNNAFLNEKLASENEQLKREMEEFKEVIIDKVQYGEDNLEEFLIKKGIISEDWARFDGYD